MPFTLDASQVIVLKDLASKKTVPCQAAATGSGTELTWLVSGLKAGESRKYEAKAVEAKSAPTPAVLVDDQPAEGRVDVHVRKKLFTSYHYGDNWVRPFLYPIVGPGDTLVTRGWPIVPGIKGEKEDHPHHKSIWVAYGECDKVDNWSEDPGHGFQRHQRFLNRVSGDVYGRITARNAWMTNKEKRQFTETRDMWFYALPGGEQLFDFSVTFHMTEKAVTFRDTKEGGILSVRVTGSMDVTDGGRIENAYGGINEGETWGKSAPWCDYSGEVNGRHVGIAVMDHETNPRYPTGWHVRDYGLMTANPFAWSYYRPEAKRKGDMTFKKGSKTTWRYRVLVHKGEAGKGHVAARFIDYIAPPAVEVA